MAENTPFLGDDDHGDDYGGESHPLKRSPANAHFQRALKIITAITSLFSIAVFGLLIASYVLTSVGPFSYTYGTTDTARDLAIVLFVNFLLSAPTIFLQFPILLNIATHIAMSVVVFVFSGQIFGHGWPDSSFCYRYDNSPGHSWRPLPETWECRKARNVIRIMMGVSAGVGILIGITILATLLLRVVALFRTKFWEGRNFSKFEGFSWKPTGFTVQFTLSVLKQEPADGGDRNKGKTIDTSSRSEEGRLIET